MTSSSHQSFIVVLLFLVSSSSNEDMSRFSTKTAYIFKQQPLQDYPSFVPVKVWAILRHGTRLPTKKVISRYNGLVDIRDEMLHKSKVLSDQQRAAFERWKPMEIHLDQQKFLTHQGEQELHNLGSRFRERFPMFFHDDSFKFTFKHTPTQRTKASADKFIEGLLRNAACKHESVVVAQDDPVLRPYKGCTLWRATVKKNKEVSLKEKYAFEAGEEVSRVVSDFKEFTQVDHLTINDIEIIYTMCGFETSWQYQLFNGKSVWCSLFQNDHQLKVMEYLEDLEYYWIDGHGFEITRRVACKTVEDIFSQLDSPTEKNLTFYFTHSGTILKLLTFLELYKDSHDLTADKLQDDRLWKTSNIDTFASNIYVVLYESLEHGPHIQLLHQEEVINVPKCQMNQFGMCSYDEFRKIFGNKITNCSLEELCQSKDEL